MNVQIEILYCRPYTCELESNQAKISEGRDLIEKEKLSGEGWSFHVGYIQTTSSNQNALSYWYDDF